MKECPYKNIIDNYSFLGKSKKTEEIQKICPITIKPPNEIKMNVFEKKEDSSDDENKLQGGCPVMNKSNKIS